MATESPAEAWLDSRSTTLLDVEALEKEWKDVSEHLPPITVDDSKKDLTLYEILESREDTAGFFNLLKLCRCPAGWFQDKEDEHTVFVPSNSAIESWLKEIGCENPDHIVAGAFLQYHISPHYIDSKHFFYMPNIPMLKRGPKMNGPWVIRVRPGSKGYRANIFAKVTGGDFKASNGIIHFIDKVLLASGSPQEVISTLPTSDLSTFQRAFELSGVADELAAADFKGSTIFVPDNAAFDKLGPSINDLLFNQEEGKKYLNALLKNHLSVNQTLFSNFFYPKNVTNQRLRSSEPEPRLLKGKRSFNFPTFHSDKGGEGASHSDLSITVARYGGYISMAVNDIAIVTWQDIPTDCGALHIVDHVLVPNLSAEEKTRELTLDEFKAKLEPLL